MTRERPSLAELRARVFKQAVPCVVRRETEPGVPSPHVPIPANHRDGAPGNVLARYWGRPSALYGTWLAVRLGLSANQVTLAALVAGLGAAGAIGTGTRGGFLVGIALAHLAFWLDHVDGQVARWRGTSGTSGVYFDYLMHHAQALALGFGLGHGLALRTGNPSWSVAGFLVAAGWMFLGIHNDCRYKAFFQRLKVEARTFRVEGGSGGRPSPPAHWPRRGLGVLTWPAYKACEPHVVLMTLTVLGLVAVIWPTGWTWLVSGYVAAMAVLAPVLAAARATRAIRRDAVGAEFDRWFRPEPGR